MMRKGIKYHDVENAYYYLIKKGEIPTYEKIRQYLGSGSLSTINKFLNRLKENIHNPKRNKSYYEGYEEGINDAIKLLKKLI